MSTINVKRSIIILGSVVLALSVLAPNALAQTNPFDIDYPISELGNCESQNECKVYCDDPANQDACVAFARQAGMISDQDAQKYEDSKRFTEERNDFEGPGGCKSPEECDAYCSGGEHINECLDFSVKEGFLSEAEAEEMKAQAERGGPGGCKSREECDNFCRTPGNNRVCMEFSVAEGFMTQEEADFMLEMMQRHEEFEPKGPGDHRGPGGPGDHDGPDDEFDEEKARALIEGGTAGPGGCSSMSECESYCGSGAHEEECMAFALENGLIPPEKAELFKRIMETGGPGGCKGQKECDQFCSEESNQEICMNFAIENNLVPPEEIKMMRKMMDRGGPGGCKGKEECDNYCDNKDHGEECVKFSVEMGMMTEEEAEKMIGFMRRMKERDEMMNREGEMHDREDMRRGPPPGDFGPDGMEHDRGPKGGFNMFGGPEHGDGGDFGPPKNGPGGCSTPEECDNYCRNNPEECGFSPEGDDRRFQKPQEDFREFYPPDDDFLKEDFKQHDDFDPSFPGPSEGFIDPAGNYSDFDQDFPHPDEVFRDSSVDFGDFDSKFDPNFPPPPEEVYDGFSGDDRNYDQDFPHPDEGFVDPAGNYSNFEPEFDQGYPPPPEDAHIDFSGDSSGNHETFTPENYQEPPSDGGHVDPPPPAEVHQEPAEDKPISGRLNSFLAAVAAFFK